MSFRLRRCGRRPQQKLVVRGTDYTKGMKRIILNDYDDQVRQIYLLDLETSHDFTPKTLSLSRYFVCLVSWDIGGVPYSDLAALTESLVLRGCVFFLAWGEDCENLHDAFDDQALRLYPDGPVRCSTWHNDEDLSDVIRFGGFNCWPADPFDHECDDFLLITIGMPGKGKAAIEKLPTSGSE
jgi:hypothetical protein